MGGLHGKDQVTVTSKTLKERALNSYRRFAVGSNCWTCHSGHWPPRQRGLLSTRTAAVIRTIAGREQGTCSKQTTGVLLVS